MPDTQVSTGRVATAPVAEGLFTTDPPQLLGACCRACGRLSFPATSRWCPYCRADAPEVRPLPTTGTVYSYTIVRVPVPGYTGPTPYGLGLVELAGIRVASTLVADPLESLSVGATVRFCLLDVGTPEDPLLSYGYRLERP
ncbi:MAG TPA: OB-fold domain-containing protein [Pseudonocardia sp.]|jgi:uncharacterized OB-fold protein